MIDSATNLAKSFPSELKFLRSLILQGWSLFSVSERHETGDLTNLAKSFPSELKFLRSLILQGWSLFSVSERHETGGLKQQLRFVAAANGVVF